jgi:hypothetical protein
MDTHLETLIKLVLDLGLTVCDRVNIITLITVDVHNRDVVGKLIESKTQDPNDFAWQTQMRYAWDAKTQDCQVKIADAVFHYSYEYVGNTRRLVIAPLTDCCYITLTQALRLMMGGAPAGPAGMGKTETTKDLGRAMGLPVYVSNCSEQMNVHSMAAIDKGLAQTGAWGCFDEFNRIPIEVLSVVSTQVATILNAMRRTDTDVFDFMGEDCSIVRTVGMFITMNPGYAGRTELPENLKVLFRSCAMVVPDIELICGNMLMSEGTRLAKKFFMLYSLCKELLSKQMHYDWGLRATKAVLRVAGSLKRAEIKAVGDKNCNEDSILMRALRDFNLPKLVDTDKPIFLNLVMVCYGKCLWERIAAITSMFVKKSVKGADEGAGVDADAHAAKGASTTSTTSTNSLVFFKEDCDPATVQAFRDILIRDIEGLYRAVSEIRIAVSDACFKQAKAWHRQRERRRYHRSFPPRQLWIEWPTFERDFDPVLDMLPLVSLNSTEPSSSTEGGQSEMPPTKTESDDFMVPVATPQYTEDSAGATTTARGNNGDKDADNDVEVDAVAEAEAEAPRKKVCMVVRVYS